MGLIKTLAVIGGTGLAINELTKNKTANRSANVAVKNTVDSLAVKEAIAKDPNLLALVRGETGPQGPQGPMGNVNTANHEFELGVIKVKKNNLGITELWLEGETKDYRFSNYEDDMVLQIFNNGVYGGNLLKIDSSGAVFKIGGGSFSAISDERVKDNIQVFNKGLETVLNIETKTFKYKKVAGTQTEFYPDSICNKTQYGVIAQQLKEVCPEMVTQDEKGFYSVDLSNLNLMLVNAVKELSTKLDTVTANYESLLQGLKHSKPRP